MNWFFILMAQMGDYEDYHDYDYETTDEESDDLNDFIDDNNYSLSDNEAEDQLSVEIIDPESNSSDESITHQIVDQNSNQTNDSNNVNQEVERLQSEHNYDSKPDIKALNETIYCSQDNGDNNCIICTEMWTNTGDHQLVSLSCGHLFGRKCIEQWLDPKNKQNQRCPHCNKTAKKRDIRVLYARNLRALDTSERDRALEMLEKERHLRKRLETEAIENSIKLKSILKENERLKKEYIECQQRVQLLSSNHRVTEKALQNRSVNALNKKKEWFQLVREMELSSSGDCRHLGYSSLFEIIAISQPNSNTQLFPGFGVKKVFLNDFKFDNICIHSKPIRDMEINAYDGTILTTSLDKTVKLTSLLNKSSILSYNLESDAWSVAFNPKNRREFNVGLNNGKILLFDTRMMSSHIDELNCSDSSPVVCLNQMEFQSPIGSINGILSTQFQNFSLYQRKCFNDSVSSCDFTAHKIPIEGRFGWTHFEPKLGLTLLSCRPSSKHTKTTHYVCL